MSDNWIVQNIEKALATWDNALAEIQSILTVSPQGFRGGTIWNAIVSVNGALKAVGYALLVLFFLIGVMKTCGSIAEVKRPEHALKLFLRFILAKGVIDNGLEIMEVLIEVVQGILQTILGSHVISGTTTIAPELVTAIENCDFIHSIPLWIVAILGHLGMVVITIVLILTVYGRFFKIFIYIALAPVPLSTFAGEPTGSVGKNFIRSYAGVCLQGVVIALSCIIFSAISSSPPAVDTSASVVTAVWTYVGELAFNLLVLVGAIKGCDRIVKEIMGL
mgnify:CR=1 FL=1